MMSKDDVVVDFQKAIHKKWAEENGALLSSDFQIHNILAGHAAQGFTNELQFSVRMDKGKVTNLDVGVFQEIPLNP